MKNAKYVIRAICLIMILMLCTAFPATAKDDYSNAKNIILLIGDGMGDNQINYARLIKGSSLNMDELVNKAKVTTASADNAITDSAAAATTMACGVKTKNGSLGVDADGNSVKNIIDIAKAKSKSTGLVTTTRITYATPAAFASHVDSRSQEEDIAQSMIDYKVNVLLGGGQDVFNKENKDAKILSDVAKTAGYTIVKNRDELLKYKGDLVLGLFNADHMQYDLTRDKAIEPSVAEMTDKAIKLLSSDKDGFFLMVEGGKIDIACHENKINDMAQDTIAFDDAVKIALDYAKKDKNTLVIVTADHETGGLTATDASNKDTYQFTSVNHTGTDVNVFAYGPNAEKFINKIDDTDIFKIMKASYDAPIRLKNDDNNKIRDNKDNDLVLIVILVSTLAVVLAVAIVFVKTRKKRIN